MSEIVQLTLMLCLVIAMFVGGALLLKRSNRVAITGTDSDGYTLRQLCRVNRHGGATYKARGGRNVHLELDQRFAFPGKGRMEYFADVRHDQGRLYRPGLEPDEKSVTLDGSRLWKALIGGGLKDIAEASGQPLEKMLLMVLIAVGVVVLMLLGGGLYLFDLLQQSQIIDSGAQAAPGGGL